MHFKSTLVAAVAAPLFVSAQLDCLAVEANKLYFGTATDNGELNNTQYKKILTNTREFGQLTPSNGQKVRFSKLGTM
jgi:endo-1,4-beta-xylanase